MRYTPERKEAVLKKMMPPHARPVSHLAIEEGISEATLYKWRQEARQRGILLPSCVEAITSNSGLFFGVSSAR